MTEVLAPEGEINIFGPDTPEPKIGEKIGGNRVKAKNNRSKSAMTRVKGCKKTPGSGRRKGSRNKRTEDREAAQVAQIRASQVQVPDGTDRSKITPTDVFAAIYQAEPVVSDDPMVLRADQELRLRAAIADAPIRHPRMAPIPPAVVVDEHTSFIKALEEEEDRDADK